MACSKQPPVAAEGEVVFEDGQRVRLATIEPAQLLPGQTLAVQLERRGGETGTAWLRLVPPRVLGRQLAVGGGPPPPAPAPDPRVASIEVPAGDAPKLSLAMPEGWHAKTAALVLERDGVAAVGGPRTADGRAILALLPVDVQPTAVQAPVAPTSPVIDGRLEDPLWERAPWTALVDSQDGEPETALRTEVAFAWDRSALYMAVRARDEDVWSTLGDRDAPLWEQEAVELFIFGDDRRARYLELQVAPTGAVFDARFETYRRADTAWNGTWRSGVAVDGTVAKRGDRDRGFTVELAVPWTEICEHTEVRCPPQPGQRLRLNVFRLDRNVKSVRGLALSPPQVPDFHAPEHAAVLELR